MALSPLAGKPAPKQILVYPSRLEHDYLERWPDSDDPAQQVSFGTSAVAIESADAPTRWGRFWSAAA